MIHVSEPDSRGKVEVTRDGATLRVDPKSASSLRSAAKVLGCAAGEIVAAVARAGAPPEVFRVATTLPEGRYECTEPLAALDAALASGARFLRWDGTDRMVAVDVDVVQAFDSVAPVAEAAGADRAWVTDSGGLRLIFAAAAPLTARERGELAVELLALRAMPQVERVEFLATTRRAPSPVSTHTAPVSWLLAHAEGGELSEAECSEVEAWLAEHGLARGRRHSHDTCVIDPCETSGTPPVVPLDGGIYCYRCAGVTGDGFRSYATILGCATAVAHPLLAAARARVHWAHARVTLGCSEGAYRGALRATGADDDTVAAVFNPNWCWLRGEGGMWLHAQTLSPADVSRALPLLSWTRGGSPDLVAQAINSGPLEGMAPVRATSCVLNPGAVPPGVVAIGTRADVDPRRADALRWDDAFCELEVAFPALSELYLRTLLLACACAEAGGEIAGLLVLGPSGSGKTATPLIAANLLGARVASLRLDVPCEDWRRQIGQALTQGQRPLVVNEIDKLRGLRGAHAQKLLDLQDPHQWRPLHGSDVQTAWRAPLVLTGIRAPGAFAAPELGRRYRVLRLATRVPDWHISGGAKWRERVTETEALLGEPPRRARVADSLLRHACEDRAPVGGELVSARGESAR